jgi:hypothetical protein
VTEDFLGWLCARFAQEGKKVFVLVWDNASWHINKRVGRWIGEHNRKVKRAGGCKIRVCGLPVKAPWLNPIEPKWRTPEAPFRAHFFPAASASSSPRRGASRQVRGSSPGTGSVRARADLALRHRPLSRQFDPGGLDQATVSHQVVSGEVPAG